MNIFKIVLGAIVVIMGIISLTTEYFLAPYMFLCLGVVNIIDSVQFYKREKKVFAGIMLLFGLIIIIMAIVIY